MGSMSTATTIPAELMARLQQAADNAAAGANDPAQMRKAAERMDQLRETVLKRHGLLDIAVPSIRELRDS